ncbi:MAG TPA: hypothetical protein VMS93_04685, partial [Candidatus Saccharimonadales bacterium]|nr:hypothetical protein [Candidatus Saccharimonadales bacterium]
MTWKTAVLAVVLTMVAACAALAQQSPAGGENRSAADLQQLRQELLDSLAAVRKLAPPPPAGPPRPSVDGLVFFRWNDDIKQLPGHNVFDFDRVYLTVRGSLERKVSYRLTLDAARTDRLTNYVRYCFAQVALHQAAVVRLGIQLTP